MKVLIIINIVIMFLTRIIKLWWINHGEYVFAQNIKERIENWEQMKANLKNLFGQGSQGWISQNELMNL